MRVGVPSPRRCLLLAAAALLLASGCSAQPALSSSYVSELPRLEQPPGTHRRPAPDPAPPPPPQPVRARILVVGDLLMHTPLVLTSEQREGNDWDFKPLFEPVRPWIEAADLAIANLETTLTGSRFPWAGYPSFNTPPELARDARAVGFDALTRANNHALDYGEYGLQQTSAGLDRYGMPHTGASRTPAEREQILVLDAGGIKVALLNYTYGTNGIPLPEPWSVNMLDSEQIRRDIGRARNIAGVDLVAVALHMGVEYARDPSEEQIYFVNLALEAGADIILGNHPHVIQRIERRGGKAVVFSLGNFISNQVGLSREAGLMLLIDVRKDPGGAAYVEHLSFIPTYVHTYFENGVKRYRVVAVQKALRDYDDQADPLVTPENRQRLLQAWADTLDRAIGSPEVRVWSVEQPKGIR